MVHSGDVAPIDFHIKWYILAMYPLIDFHVKCYILISFRCPFFFQIFEMKDYLIFVVVFFIFFVIITILLLLMRCLFPCSLQREINIAIRRQGSVNSTDAIVPPSTFSPDASLYFDPPPPYEQCVSRNKVSESY